MSPRIKTANWRHGYPSVSGSDRGAPTKIKDWLAGAGTGSARSRSPAAAPTPANYTITRNGTPIARLIPLRRRTFVPRTEVLVAFASAPTLDADRFRRDLDAAIDQDLVDREW